METTTQAGAAQNGLVERSPDETKIAVSRNEGSGTFSLAPRNFEEAWRMAQIVAGSDMVPNDYKGKAGNVLIAMEMGSELGLKPVQALQNIAVINGRPSVWGDAVLAILQGSSAWDASAFEEFFEGSKYEDEYHAVCRMRRKGGKLVERTFSVADAKQAGLWQKSGPWKQYPDRMLQMRARSFAARDTFADILRGIHVAEEVRDIQDAEVIDEETGVIIEGSPAKSRTEAVKEKLARKAAAKLAPTYDVAGTIEKMRIELEECLLCETREQAAACKKSVAAAYGEAVKDWSEKDQAHFREAYEEAVESIAERVKEMPSGKKAADSSKKADGEDSDEGQGELL